MYKKKKEETSKRFVIFFIFILEFRKIIVSLKHN